MYESFIIYIKAIIPLKRLGGVSLSGVQREARRAAEAQGAGLGCDRRWDWDAVQGPGGAVFRIPDEGFVLSSVGDKALFPIVK